MLYELHRGTESQIESTIIIRRDLTGNYGLGYYKIPT